LVSEDNGDELRFGEKGGIGMENEFLSCVPEDKVAKGYALRSSLGGGERIFARPHREKESADDDVSSVVVLVGPDFTLV
jgi:hypothetical protein